MKDDTVDLVLMGERLEVSAWQSALSATPEDARRPAGLGLETGPGGAVAISATKLPTPFMNRIIGLGLDGPVDREWLADRLARYAAAGQPYSVSLCEELAGDLGPWLVERGLTPRTRLAKMARRTDDLPPLPDGPAIRDVGVEEAGIFADTACRGFGLPESLEGMFAPLPALDAWRNMLTWVEGAPAGTGSIHLGKDAAWIGNGSVLPDYRRRGLHRHSMLHRMHRAADLGVTWILTETNRPGPGETGPSFRNMQALGFRIVCERPNFLSTA